MIENISYRAEALEVNRLFGIFFKIFSKSYNKIVNGSGFRAPGVSPTDLQKFSSRNRLTPIGDKEFKQPDFLFG